MNGIVIIILARHVCLHLGDDAGVAVDDEVDVVAGERLAHVAELRLVIGGVEAGLRELLLDRLHGPKPVLALDLDRLQVVLREAYLPRDRELEGGLRDRGLELHRHARVGVGDQRR